MQIPADAIPDTMVLQNRELAFLSCSLPQLELKFYPENPRIYSSVWIDEDDRPSQEAIFAVLSKSEHVRETLLPSIRDNGGLIEPILVRDGVVLEGNSRLAAYRLLSQADAERWRLIRARVLPTEVTESEIFSLLGQYHMVGKKDWPPYEQAGYLYRRSRDHEMADDELAREVGLPVSKVRHLIAVYSFMVVRKDRSPDRWSYYDELLKGRRFDEARKKYRNFDEHIANLIDSGEISRAVDLRDELPKIVKAEGNTLKKFMSGGFTFAEASEEARLRGAGNYHVQKLKTFRKWLADDTLDADIQAMTSEDAKLVKFEIDKLQTRISQLAVRLAKSRAR